MNGNLSLIDNSQSSLDKNSSPKIDTSKDIIESEQNDTEKLSNSKSIEGSIAADTPKEEEIIDAPSDGVRSSGLVERLKRSLGVPAEEVSCRLSNLNHYLP